MIWIPNPSIKSKLIRYTVAFAKVTKWHLGHQGNDRRLRGDLYSILTTPEIDRYQILRVLYYNSNFFYMFRCDLLQIHLHFPNLTVCHQL